jgi:hypothetical protein
MYSITIACSVHDVRTLGLRSQADGLSVSRRFMGLIRAGTHARIVLA